MDTTLTLSFTPDEVITAGTVLELRSPRPLEPRSAQGAITLRRNACAPVPTTIALTRRGRAARVDTSDLAPGAYELCVGELLDTKGGRVSEARTFPFVVSAFAGRVPQELRVEHVVHLGVGELSVRRLAAGERPADGERYVEVVKAVHRESGEAVDLAHDERGERVDADALLQEVQQRRAERFGAVHETLWQRLERLRDDDRVDVVVWPRLDDDLTAYDKPTDRRLEEPHPAERELSERVRRATADLLGELERFGADVRERPEDDVPVVHVTLPVKVVRELARADVVGAVFLDDRTAVTDLGDSIAVARSDRAHALGFDGTGVRVAVFEDGPSITTNLVFAGRYTSSPAASNHARLTCAVVKNTESGKPHGHAPDCDLYSANSSDNAALRWAAQQGCTVISQSFHRGSEPGGAGLQGDDVLKDYLALRWPYPTIVQAAGNFWEGDADGIEPPSDEYVNHKGFNTLSVGNHDDTAASMSSDSVFRNPSSAHGDRELPELAANGTGVSANGQTMSGTSFAAPATAGVTALLQDVDPVLCSWPEGCRAILLASAGRNVSGSTWWSDVASRTDASDGAGALDAESGVRIAQQRRWRGAPATARGWDVGTLTSADVGGDRLATFRYHVQVPSFGFVPKVKVALAWDAKVTSFLGLPLSSNLTVDLDLIVRDSHGTQVGASASWDNSYEVVEFSAARGETYEIVVRRWSGSDSVWFGIAWAATAWFPWGDLMVRPPFVLERLP
ncbi:S8 family serine peptidase [Angustibacter sp. Root456]|uniref:S8 family serine peptidase n=1 Tax=Angustibacter sp. Root456 TaxID=1736539 RepID=UPI0006F3D0B6|nr:S8 family serine peptidase [Angustibacter sp. Root456]KQX63632.1 hypothetical protein ASD06_10885 [Angustibacter sp. Root456]